MRTVALSAVGLIALVALVVQAVQGDGGCGCCPHCGCSNLKKVCQVVPVTKKVPKVELSCKCEDICVPGKSIYCGKECVTDCDGCYHQEKVYQPTCGKVYTKTSIVKTTRMIEQNGYTCVVQTVCCNCGGCCGSGSEYGAQSYAPAPGAPPVRVIPHEEPHPLRTQSN